MKSISIISIYVSLHQKACFGFGHIGIKHFVSNNIPPQKLPFLLATINNEVIKSTTKNNIEEELEKVFYNTLYKVDKQHEKSSFQSNLACETIDTTTTTITPKYECIYGNKAYNNKPIAYRSIGDRILHDDDIRFIIKNAESYWNDHPIEQEDTSRFTLQFKGNSEIHIDDLCTYNPKMKTLLDTILNQKIYPLIRSAFNATSEDAYQLCIYDALYVRYNANKAKEYYGTNVTGASQPLHRDLGLFSVNIALNNDFDGGGTFFENKIYDKDNEAVLYPTSPGHCLVHNSWERHAGAPTTNGIRDIIVLFISSRQNPIDAIPPIMERFARIKGMLRPLPVSQRIYTMNKLIQMAKSLNVNEVSYGEAYLWLGFDLMQKHEYEAFDSTISQEIKHIQRYNDMNDAIQAFTKGVQLLPNDARAYFHLASALDTRLKYFQQYKSVLHNNIVPSSSLNLQTEVESIISSYKNCIDLERVYTTSGLKQADDWMEACVRLGTVYAQYSNFGDALLTFQDIVQLNERNDVDRIIIVPEHILDEATKAIEFCKERIQML